MTGILDFRARLIKLYQKIDYVVIPVLRLILMLIAYHKLRALFDFDKRLSAYPVTILLSLIGALVPSSVSLALMVIYISLQLFFVSQLMSVVTLMIAAVMYCFFIRLIPRYSSVIIGMPLLIGIRLPYLLPISLGLFSGPVSIVPVCLGVFSYFYLHGIKNNMATIEQIKSSTEPAKLYFDVYSGLIQNDELIAMLIVFSLVILSMCLIKNIKMDYVFEIAIVTGSVMSMLAYIIMMLRSDVGESLSAIIIGSALSGLLVLVINFFYRPLYYAGTQKVQFEDDDYYYYVHAVPKIKSFGTQVSERQFITGGREDYSETEDEESY